MRLLIVTFVLLSASVGFAQTWTCEGVWIASAGMTRANAVVETMPNSTDLSMKITIGTGAELEGRFVDARAGVLWLKGSNSGLSVRGTLDRVSGLHGDGSSGGFKFVSTTISAFLSCQ